jgi:hypothetical protein
MGGSHAGVPSTSSGGSDYYVIGGLDDSSHTDPSYWVEQTGFVFSVTFNATPELDGSFIGHGTLELSGQHDNSWEFTALGSLSPVALHSERNLYYYLDELGGVVVRDSGASWTDWYQHFAINGADEGEYTDSDGSFDHPGYLADSPPGGGSEIDQLD